MSSQFNPPPAWPEATEELRYSHTDVTVHPSWPDPPGGWHLFFDSESVGTYPDAQSPVEYAGALRASSTRPEKSKDYPVLVENPGELVKVEPPTLAHAEAFGAVASVHSEKRRRRESIILGFVGFFAILAASTILWWIYTHAAHSLPGHEPKSSAASVVSVEDHGAKNSGSTSVGTAALTLETALYSQRNALRSAANRETATDAA